MPFDLDKILRDIKRRQYENNWDRIFNKGVEGMPDTQAKFIQLVVKGDTLYALDEEGLVWFYSDMAKKWKRFTGTRE